MHKLLLDIPNAYETERLSVRSYRAGDGTWYYPMSQRNQPHLARFEAGNPVMSIHSEEDAEILVRDFAANWVGRSAFFMAAFRKEDGVFVGQIYIGAANWLLPEFEVGYFVDAAQEGHGYVTEAVHGALYFIFTHLGAQRIRLECDDTNLRSYHVAERCGMIREAHLRENKQNPDGSLTGTLIYGLLRHEYLKRTR